MKKLLLLFSLFVLTVSAAFSQQDVYYTGDAATITTHSQEAPPALLVYMQPICPVEGYMWQPGFWGLGDGGYFWVPGVWVRPPHSGLLWTPGYWSFHTGYYGWHDGYWGDEVGYYGGIDYGFGYNGYGFYGGKWDGGVFHYNAAVWRLGSGFHHTYSSHEDMHHAGAGHASFNGPGGVKYHPTASEEKIMHGNHVPATKEQIAHRQAAGNDRGQFAHTNKGVPAYHSMSKPGGQRFDAGGRAIHGGSEHMGSGGHEGGAKR